MAALGKYLRTLEGNLLAFWCPGCDGVHQISVNSPTRPNWTFNGNIECPTFSPSVKVTGRGWTKAGRAAYDAWVAEGCPGDRRLKFEAMDTCCHFFVTDGKMKFLGDCTHDLKNQEVDLPEFPRLDNFSLGGDL